MIDDEISWACEPASLPLPARVKAPQRILVVEGDPFFRHLSAEVLIRHGYEVNAAEDGAAAWEELQAINYSLLITDYDLTKITGIGLIKKLRAARLILPVVMIARRLPTHTLTHNPSLQPAATLLKPFAVDALLGTVEIVLRAPNRPREEIKPRASVITQVLHENPKLNGSFPLRRLNN
jgi:DNA-binding response OmpR family regulator